MNLIFIFALLFYVAENCVLCQINKNSQSNDEFDKKGDLLFVQLIFRHGDRTPLKFYKNDPWKDKTYWDDEPGELTNFGKQQQFELGQYMRDRYSSLLNVTHPEHDIYVQSSDIDRTIMSAEAFLTGMYGVEKSTNIWDTHLPWQPIPVHTTPVDYDHLIIAYRKCEAYTKSFDEFMESPKIKEFEQKHKDLYEYLSLHSGDQIQKMRDSVSIRDTIMIEDANNRTLPEWTQKIFPGGELYDSIEEAALTNFKVDTGTPFLAKIKSGFLLKDILDRFTNKSKSILDPDRNFWVYSGHDTTICRILNTLGILESLPPVSTCIMFEMRKIDDVPHIEIFLKNSSTSAIPLHIPNCGLSCPLADLFLLYKDFLPTESFENECNVEKSKISSASNNANNIILQMVTISILLLT